MAAIAAEAGVAVQTLYFTFHTKSDLLQAAYEHAVLGPDGVPPHLTDWWRHAEQEADVSRSLRHIVDGSIELLDRAAPLVCAVYRDAEARTTYESNERLRVAGYTQLVDMLARKHPLRPDQTGTTARDVLLTLLGPQVYFAFTNELGWSNSEFATWVHAALRRELFALGV